MVPELKLADITDDAYFSMHPVELEKIMRSVSRENKRWMTTMLPSTASWAYISRDKEIWGVGEGDLSPSVNQTREAAKWVKKPLFLFTNCQQRYRDTTYFLEQSAAESIEGLTKIPKIYFQPYLDDRSGVVAVNAQSGKVNALKKYYAIGTLAVMKPRDNRSEERHTVGATVADIRYVGWDHIETILYIASQSAEEVHARGSKVRGERRGEKGRILRIERLHRFDDPILDIFDTYRMKREDFWRPLVLHGPRAVYDTHMEASFLPKYGKFLPQQMELEDMKKTE